MPRRTVVEFWYDFASTYSYLAAMRVDALAEAADVDVRWRPFLLGPIFAAQGWTSSPFTLYPVKGRNMWRDVEREAALQGLPPLTRPDPFPQNGLAATRVAVLGFGEPWLSDYSRAVYETAFARGGSIAEPAAVAAIVDGLGLGLDGEATVRAAAAEPNKARLKVVGEEARSRGIFGAPSFLAEDGELFWGNDRLPQALAWAGGQRPPGVR